MIRTRKRALPQRLELNGLKRIKANLPFSEPNPGCLTPTQSPPVFPAFESRGRNGRRVGHYFLLLDETGGQAIDTRTQQLKCYEELSASRYEHLIKVTERLNRSDELWGREDARDLRERIVPADIEVVTGDDGKRYAMTEGHFGTLHTMVQGKKTLGEQTTRTLYSQIVRMVAFCHRIGIVVRDLKLRKFVFADEERTRLRLSSIEDLVVCVGPGQDQLSDRHGCPAYVSPEILDLEQSTYSGRSADLWSLGVVLFVMLLGRYPFYDNTPVGLFDKIRNAQFCLPDDHGLSLTAASMLHSLLRRDPLERPAAEQLLALSWLQSGTELPARHLSPFKRAAMKKNDAANDQVVPCI